MRVGIDCRMYHQSGIGRYIRNLVNHLQEIDSRNEYFLFLKKEDMENIKVAQNFHKVCANFGWYGLAEQLRFPKLLTKYNLDLVHFPNFNVPIFYKGDYIVTIHDLTQIDFKTQRASTLNPLFYRIKHQSLKEIVKRAVKKSKHIITVSEFVRKELSKRYGIKDSKISATYEAVEEEFIQMTKKVKIDQAKLVLDRKGINQPYIFYIGNASPHKNIEKLIQVFKQIKDNHPQLQLVLAGADSYFWNRIKKEYPERDIIYTGFVNDEELVSLFTLAQAFILPSLSEGFGIPLLEAMASSCPVVCSNITALPEVGGGAAIYFDPKNEEDMFKKITQVIDDQYFRTKLIKAGQKRYQQFSWKKLAEQTLEIYQQNI